MAVTLSDLSYTKNYDDLAVLTEAYLDSAYTSMQTYINDTIKDNLVQLADDCFGQAVYTFDSDGNPQYTNTLFAKQYMTDFYNGGDISIGVAADVAWVAVDAVNAAVSITPEIAGQYRAVFYFTHRATSDATTLMSIDVGFRITDGTDASYAVNSGGRVAATGAGSGIVINPVFITHVFNWATTNARTIALQKYNRTMTAVNANVVNAAAATGEIYMCCEKI